MPQAGQVILIHFPQTDLTWGKLRPALIIDKLPGFFDDWLICMISAQVHHQIAGFDEIIATGDLDFPNSGLKSASLIRTGRMAIVTSGMLLGSIGEIDNNRLTRIKNNLVTTNTLWRLDQFYSPNSHVYQTKLVQSGLVVTQYSKLAKDKYLYRPARFTPRELVINKWQTPQVSREVV